MPTRFERLAATALVVVAAPACGALLGVDFDDVPSSSTGADASVSPGEQQPGEQEPGDDIDEPTPVGPGGKCSTDRKRCDDLCVARNDPAYGCNANACSACPEKPNGKSTCAAGACSVKCDPAYFELNGACERGAYPERLSSGRYHSCAIQTDGKIVCWGYVDDTKPPPGKFQQISTSGSFDCAVKTDDSVVCWGAQFTAPSGSFRQVSVDGTAPTACGIKTDGSAVCWDRYGTLGASITGPFRQISLGSYHGCGIKTDGTLKCWGECTQVPMGTFEHLSLGPDYFGTATQKDCRATAVRTGGAITSWYESSDDSSSFREFSPDKSSGTFVQASVAFFHTCGVQTNNALACWGSSQNAYGEATPQPGSFRQVSAGYNHTCGIKTDGTVACWGDLKTAPPGTFW